MTAFSLINMKRPVYVEEMIAPLCESLTTYKLKGDIFL